MNPDSISSEIPINGLPTGPVRVALDVMGADRGMIEMVKGGVLAALEYGNRIAVTLVGRKDEISAALRQVASVPENVHIAHASTEVAMTDSPSDAVRRPDTSIAVGLNLKKSGQADAFVSAGNTGAVMAGALLVLGRIPGVNRPAIAAIFPTTKNRNTIVLDVGANPICKPINIAQFGAMGVVYARQVHGIPDPTVGLLSIGEERSKGHDLIVKSHELFERSGLNFVGNVEGRDILCGESDVVVTDGFTGNVILKFAESIEHFLTARIRHQVSTNVFSRIGAALLYPFLRRLRRTFDYAEAGGAPLLGVEGVVMICHGSSSSRAIKNAVRMAYEMVATGVIARTREEMRVCNLLEGVAPSTVAPVAPVSARAACDSA